MSNNLRLQVILQTIDKASAVLKKIQGSSDGAAQALKATRDKLKELNAAQSNVTGYRQATIEVRKQQRALQELQAKVTAHTATLEQQRTAHVNIKAALNTSKHSYDKLTQAYMDGKDQSAAATRQMELARITLLSNQGAYEKSLASINKYKAQVKNAGDKVAQTTKQHSAATARLQGYKTQLDAAGISTSGLGNKSRAMRSEIDATTRSVEAQKQKLKALAEQQKKLDDLKSSHAKKMMQTGILAGVGVAGMAAGRGMARPVGAALGAYGQQEDATSQLRGSMMLANGSVSAEFKAINELAQRLGDRLPGTTADFIDMMTMLQRQGLSAKAVLGGTGEAAAYLGVQLRMPVTAAAEFAAKMQDATRTTEGDMMSLMDTIQRTFYLGVDSGNMLQGFTKMGPALSIIHQQGLQAANTLAPLLVMMDQAGMAGEASGNAIRKVLQGTLDAKKLGKANKLLGGEGFQLKFVNGKGQFAGLEQLYSQLAKLKGITSDVKRTSVIKELFGDDAETMQVLNTLMDKGLDGYKEVTLKMKAQADLRQRVDQQLKTLNNIKEAAMGTGTNVLAALGETVAPDAKALVDWLGEVAGKTRKWIEENSVLVGWLVKTVAVVAALAFVLGTIAVTVASVLVPFFMLRFAMAWIGLQGSTFALVLRVLGSALGFVGTMLTWLGRALLMNPIGLTITAIAAAAMLIYYYWGPISQFFTALWNTVKSSFLSALNYIQDLRLRFYNAGADMIKGMADGITGALGSVKEAIVGAGSAAIGWFKEKLGIHSPSLVFTEAGANISAGAALGITSGLATVRKAAAGLSLAAAGGLPLAGAAEPMRFDTRAPLSASAAATAPASAGASSYNITINATPGMDPQTLARAVSAELDKRERQKRAAGRSSLSDLN